MYSIPASRNQVILNFRRIPWGIAAGVVLLAVALPRVMLLGGLPTTDEGAYLYYAQIMHASLIRGDGLPDTGPLMLYPMLLNWIFSLKGNAFIAFRVADMLVASLAGYVFFRVIEAECRNRTGGILIAAIFLFVLNQPIFIQSGFKNSIYAAYLPLLTALWLGLNAPDRADVRRWIGIGALLALTVLLRETFAPLAALGALTALLSRGWRALVRIIIGAAVTTLAVVGVVMLARGGTSALLDSYKEAGIIYNAVMNQRSELFFSAAVYVVRENIVILALASIGSISVIVDSVGGKSTRNLSRLVFWLLVTAIPLIEPASKIGFPYHFGVCLIGLAGITALGWRIVWGWDRAFLRGAAVVGMCASLLGAVVPRMEVLTYSWLQTREALAAFSSGGWPEEFTSRSNYLLAAQAIRQASLPGGTIAISGFMHALYPLTGHLPAAPELANLTSAVIQLKLSSSALRDVLLRCSPGVIMTTTRVEWPGAAEILTAVRETNLYEEFAEISSAGDRSYGTFGGLVLRLAKPAQSGHDCGHIEALR
ncbi:hypothetical protein [Bordetella sp. LUAb4]|uniref:hypothetical protein n=1 Tax=Bordetella sp. LUAb4 TaxID=2843195 RepID=UPI001E5BCDE8|nr:hypothetical protein [Bordetella sp. LUAb4]